MTSPKIYDCFPYFNEKEILELRIKLLYDHVDGFIITEGNLTHSGNPKPFTCEQTLALLDIPLDKIKVIPVELPTLQQTTNHWIREQKQRDWAANYFEPDCVYIVSDCDEIIDPQFIPSFANAAINDPVHIYRFHTVWLSSRADLRVCDSTGQNWNFLTPFVCTLNHVQHFSLSQIREDKACELNYLPFKSLFLMDQNQIPVDCGWHFSWMGGAERMKFKMCNYAHCGESQQGVFSNAVGAVNSEQMISYLDSYIPQPGSKDPYGRSDFLLKSYPIDQLPRCLLDMKHLHEYFFGKQK